VGDTTFSGGRFRVLRTHARGGIGMVSVALDVELNREVALKEIQPDQADDLASRARFVLEAEVTGRLEHPGVVPVYGLGTSPEGRTWVEVLTRMELLPDGAIRVLDSREWAARGRTLEDLGGARAP
jgi:serine/threonine protein kinase